MRKLKERHDYNTAMPVLSGVREQAEFYNDRGYDVHTIKIELNGSSGAFDVFFLATDKDMEDHVFLYSLESHGALTYAGRG